MHMPEPCFGLKPNWLSVVAKSGEIHYRTKCNVHNNGPMEDKGKLKMKVNLNFLNTT